MTVISFSYSFENQIQYERYITHHKLPGMHVGWLAIADFFSRPTSSTCRRELHEERGDCNHRKPRFSSATAII